MRPPHRDGDPADPRLGGGEGPRITTSGARTPSCPGGSLLLLREEQVAALRAVLEGYRQYAFQQVLPTTERNERLRQTQALLGRLHELAPPSGGECWLSLSPDELSRLQQVLQVVHEQPALRQCYGQELAILAGPAGRSPEDQR